MVFARAFEEPISSNSSVLNVNFSFRTPSSTPSTASNPLIHNQSRVASSTVMKLKINKVEFHLCDSTKSRIDQRRRNKYYNCLQSLVDSMTLETEEDVGLRD